MFPGIVWAGRSWPRAIVVSPVLVTLALTVPPVAYFVPFILGVRMTAWQSRSAALEAPAAQWLGAVSYSHYLTHWSMLEAGLTTAGSTWCMPCQWRSAWHEGLGAAERLSILASWIAGRARLPELPLSECGIHRSAIENG